MRSTLHKYCSGVFKGDPTAVHLWASDHFVPGQSFFLNVLNVFRCVRLEKYVAFSRTFP